MSFLPHDLYLPSWQVSLDLQLKNTVQYSHITGFLDARDPPAGSFANMVRTDDTIFRLPRAVAELTLFRTGGVSLFGGSLLASAGLSDVDFFSDVG